jgi:YhcN/YlaJ family sporulation lipoprotein
MRNKLIKLLVIAVVFSMLIGLPACMPMRRPAPTPAPTPTNPENQLGQQNMTPGQNAQSTTAADRVVRLVNAMPEVKGSYALVVGNVAMVGVDMRDKLSGDKENELKDRISADTKRQMPELAEVWVTADPDLVTRIRDLAGRIARGEPITGFFEEISNIAKKLQPKGS